MCLMTDPLGYNAKQYKKNCYLDTFGIVMSILWLAISDGQLLVGEERWADEYSSLITAQYFLFC